MEGTVTKEQSCEERIDGQKKGRIETFAALVAGASVYDQEGLDNLSNEALGEIVNSTTPERDREELTPEEVQEQAQTAIYELPLSVETHYVVRIDLSTGGPGDWLEAHVDAADKTISRIEYHFNDWFDHASRVLDGEEFDTAERFIETLMPLDMIGFGQE
jgi:hypothetical protein